MNKEFHGEKQGRGVTPEYEAYGMAKRRCRETSHARYGDYGGRGIEFRFNSFQEFVDELGRRPSPAHSLDRIDNDGHYEKGNVRWATRSEQSENRRNRVILQMNGETLNQTQWAKKLGIGVTTIFARRRVGWCTPCILSPKKAFTCTHR